ncbi:MAG: hypothetical protein M1827_004549 [Pycnora praestabilis]|nr:MAG: hypothetical protein M1827_004549 [Pycnora praestabilis]
MRTLQQEVIKNEMTLPEDDLKLVRKMLDYLYNLNYNDWVESVNQNIPFIASSDEVNPTSGPSSPVARTVQKFEKLSSPITEQDQSSLPHQLKKEKKRKKEKSLWHEESPSIESEEPQYLVLAEVDWRTDKLLTDSIPNSRHEAEEMSELHCREVIITESSQVMGSTISLHAQMYALADKYRI